MANADTETSTNPGYQCDGILLFEETERAKSWYENPVFFRYGYNSQMKLNQQNQMVQKYEADRWYRFDLILDWTTQEVAFFIDGKYKQTQVFYSKERD